MEQSIRPEVLRYSDQLTYRQMQVVDWICKGKSNKEIADFLGITLTGVKFHNTNIFKILGVHGRMKVLHKVLFGGTPNAK